MRSPGFRSPLAARRPSSAISNGGGGGAEKEVALTEREAAYPFVKKVMMPRKSGKQFDAAYTLADEISADDFPEAALYAGKTLKRSTVFGVVFCHEVVVLTLCNSFDQRLV